MNKKARYNYILLIISIILNMVSCTSPTNIYKTKASKKMKGLFCVDMPLPIIVFNDIPLIYMYKIIVQNDTIFLHNEHYKPYQERTYYVDFESRELRVKNNVVFYTDSKTQRTERTWIEKFAGITEFYYVDNVEHLNVNKISYDYESMGRSGNKNEAISFLDNYNRNLKKTIFPYYGGSYGSVSSINSLHDKFIVIAPDLYNHKNAIKKGNEYKYSLYIYYIDDFLKPCMNSINNSKYFSLNDSIPYYIPKLPQELIGKVIER